jgi:hypothetical protein
MTLTAERLSKLMREGNGSCICLGEQKRPKAKPKCKLCHGSGKLRACSACGTSGYSHETRGKCPRCEGQGFTAGN